MYTLGYVDQDGAMFVMGETTAVDAALTATDIEHSERLRGIGVQTDSLAEMTSLAHVRGGKMPFTQESRKPNFTHLASSKTEFGISELGQECAFISARNAQRG